MSSIYDKSSLVLIPSGTKTGKVYSQKPVSGDGDFTFTRSSAATRVNADGNIEKETGNLLLQSNSFDTITWTKAASTIIGGQSGYDGTSDAWLLSQDGGSGYVEQAISRSGVYTLSVYAKSGSYDWLRMRINTTGTTQNAYYNLSNGTIGGSGVGVDKTIESIGGGWYKCSITSVTQSTSIRIYPAFGDGDVSGTSGNIYIQDAQVEQGLVARDYIETTTSAVYGGITDNVPRLDYTDSSCPALLLEPQRTNRIGNSEYFDSWIGSNRSYTSNETSSPEGVLNGTKLAASGGTSYYAYQLNSVSGANVFSVFLKYGTKTTQSIYAYSGGSYFGRALFDLSTGVVTNVSNGTASIVDYGNGWYRCSVQGNAATTLIEVGIEGIGASDYTYAYGAQLEAGAYATSYIPTYGSSVSRLQETNHLFDVDNNSIISDSTNFTAYFELEILGGDNPVDKIRITDSSGSPRIYLYKTTAGLTSWSNIEGLPTGSIVKFAFRADSATSISFYENGAKTENFTDSGSNPLTIDRLLMYGANGAFRVHQVALFNSRLTDQEAIDLTTI